MKQPVAASNPFRGAPIGNGMGWLTVRVTGNQAIDSAIYWGFLLAAGYAVISLGYYGVTGHSLLGSGRMPAAWEV